MLTRVSWERCDIEKEDNDNCGSFLFSNSQHQTVSGTVIDVHLNFVLILSLESSSMCFIISLKSGANFRHELS